MSTTLAEKLTSHVNGLDIGSRYPCIWSESLRKTFQKERLSHELLKQLVEDCLCLTIETQEDCLFFHQRMFSLVLFYRFSDIPLSDMKQALAPLYIKLINNQYPQGFQLLSLYREFIAFFLEEPTNSFGVHLNAQGVALMEYEGHCPEHHLPHLMYTAELALLAGLLALASHNQNLLNKALEISAWLSNFVEESRGIPEGLWMQEKEFSLEELSLVSALLFQYSSLIRPCSIMEQAYQSMMKVFTVISVQDIEVIYPLLYLLILDSTRQHPRFVECVQDYIGIKQRSSKYLGYGTYRYQDFSGYCSTSGAGSGCAGFSKGSIRITSAGPHLGALGEMNKYGIYRVPLLQQAPFKDVHIDHGEGAFSFSGWTRVIAGSQGTPKPGTSWLHLGMTIKEKRALLKTKWVNFHEDPELFFVFFVKGSKAVVDKNYHLHPETLDRYQGKASEISFQDPTASLSIKTQMPYSMQVIPLAGDRYFWGAQFLVAYTFPKEETLLFEIA